MALNLSAVDWGPVAGKLMKLGAPLAGTIIGGPLGGVAAAIIGSLASVLDTEATPEAISNKLDTDPQAAAKVQAFEENNRAQLEIEAEKTQQLIIEQSNLSLRAEITAGDKFQRYARPFNMYAVGTVTLGYGVAIVAAAFDGVISKQYESLKILMEAGPALGFALAPAGAVAGVAAWQQTKEKLAGVIQRPPPAALVPGKKK